MIEVIRHGFYTSVQDKGRFNYESYGVTLSGALDQQSFRMAFLQIKFNCTQNK